MTLPFVAAKGQRSILNGLLDSTYLKGREDGFGDAVAEAGRQVCLPVIEARLASHS